MNFKQRININLDNYSEEILPLRSGELASEYNNLITDYSENILSVTNRIIKPYLSTETHGINCYDRLLNYLKTINFNNILDLGCGSGELLNQINIKNKISIENIHGLSIHVGEVKYSREKFNLKNVIPGDMRDTHIIYENMKFDVVLLHCCLQFINESERINLFKNIYNNLNINGQILLVSYKNNKNSELNDNTEINKLYTKELVGNFNLKSMGNIYKYTKNE